MLHRSMTGIGSVTVRKDDLIAILRHNRDQHHATFETATEKFREAAIRRLDTLIAVLKRGGLPDLQLNLPLPEEHLDDYDRALRMLEMHQADNIELSEEAYLRLCDDDWGWKRAFESNTTAYAAGRYQ